VDSRARVTVQRTRRGSKSPYVADGEILARLAKELGVSRVVQAGAVSKEPGAVEPQLLEVADISAHADVIADTARGGADRRAVVVQRQAHLQPGGVPVIHQPRH